MIFTSIIVVLLLGIAFIHYIQGMFSATLSAIIAIIAAAVALGYQDSVLQFIKPAKSADIASAGVLCGLFVVTYVILRIIVDRAIPGNVRLEPTVDKVGAAVMGIIAGIVGTGIIAIATASMPFTSNLGGMYSRYTIDSDKQVNGVTKLDQGQQQTLYTYGPNKQAAFLPNDKDSSGGIDPNLNKMFIPVDDWTIGIVSDLSNGALATDHKFADVHPDYLQELYGQRTGIQAGSKHAAPNVPGNENVTVESLYLLPDTKVPPPSQDGEIKAVRASGLDTADLKPQKGKSYFVVRGKISASAADDGGPPAFSTAAVRLVVHPTDPGAKPTDIYPIGTWEDRKIWLNRMDDYLFGSRSGDTTVDFVFVLDDPTEVTTDAKAQKGMFKVQDGTIFEFKRMGMVDLSGQDVKEGLPPENKENGVMRPELLKPPPKT